ncbi:glycosyltransferase family 4 protein [Solimonas marina]|uniref:Glycosyltransferase family 4 protein n=1 Tax=Solimonas marina TaxID=2714601 RepID=A0A969WEN2_9GAMM|nr:glycosyltransferase family 1 protein [Solimonas marina]NKF23355.1 glycosyltransferase family 4 protein [Solimonas marina]
MKTRLYLDATQALNEGPRPPTGIPRVEMALARGVLAQPALSVALIRIDGRGRGRELNVEEREYLWRLAEGGAMELGPRCRGLRARFSRIVAVIDDGAMWAGKGFDRMAAQFLVDAPQQRGWTYAVARRIVGIAKWWRRPRQHAAPALRDPLADREAHCLLTTLGVRRLRAAARGDLAASLTAIVHDLIPLYAPQFFDAEHVARFERDFSWMQRTCARLICVSAATAERLRAHLRDRHPPIEMAVQRLASFPLATVERGMTPGAAPIDRPYALYCATIEVRKNHIILLRAWQRLLPELGDALPVLVLCGRWGWKYDEVRDFLAEHPQLSDKVQLRSARGDAELAQLYRHARFGVFPSHAEGWGLGAAECLDFGLPVLISDAPALAEATQQLMPIIDADDLDGWCRAIARAAQDDAWLAALRQRIRDEYRPIVPNVFVDGVLDGMARAAGVALPVVDHASAASERDKPRPVFCHSLFRSGSTYLFKVFRRSGRFQCFQEPLHEIAWRSIENHERLLEATSDNHGRLRHPQLDRPYFQELYDTHTAWKDVIRKEMVYDDYFGGCAGAGTHRYYHALSAASPRPAFFQDCRTTQRIGRLRRELGGLHLYLWREPHAQWQSYQATAYFATAQLLIANARGAPESMRRMRRICSLPSYSLDDIDAEFRKYKKFALPEEESYALFYLLWCLALLHGCQHADLLISIDRLSVDADYRQHTVGTLASQGIDGLSFDDCRAPAASMTAELRARFGPIEARVHALLIECGTPARDIELIERLCRQARAPLAPLAPARVA